MIVETHSHIGLPIEGPERGVASNYGKSMEGVEQYLATYDANGVDKCWVFGGWGWRDCSLIRKENSALAALGKDYANRLFPWGTVNPHWREKELRGEIERMAGMGLWGIKLVPLIQGSAITAPGMSVIAEEAIRRGLPVFFHDGSPEYCSAIQVAYYARKFPELKVVSGHGGLRELWPDLIPAVREVSNLWVCLSGPTQWGIQRLYDELGPEKLMFGSDGGLGHPAVVRAYLRRIERLRAPRAHKDMILGLNAMRFLSGAEREAP